MNVVPVLVPTWTPLRYARYPATPTLSVDGDQDSEAEELVTPVTARFAGDEGGVVSPPPLAVAVTEKLLVPNPWPPCQISKPASTSIR